MQGEQKTSSSILQPPQIHHPSIYPFIHFIQRNSCSKLRCIGMSHQPLKKTSDAFLYCPKEGMRMYRLGGFVCFLHSNFIGVLKNYIALVLLVVKTSRISVHLSGWREKRDVCFPGGGFPPESVYVSLGVFQNVQNNCQTHNTTCSSFHFNCIPPLRRHFLTLFLGDQILSLMLIVIHTVEEFQVKYFRLFV